jgi:hypothetical protein
MANSVSDDVPVGLRIALVAYLLLSMLAMVYLVYTLWAAEPKPAPPVIADAGERSSTEQSGLPSASPGETEEKSGSPDAHEKKAPGAVTAQETTAAPVGQSPRPPVLKGVDPPVVAVGSGQGAISIHGSGFDRESVVTFNGTQRSAQFVNERHLIAVLQTTDLAAAGPAVVRVGNKLGVSDGVTFTVLSASSIPMPWNVLGGTPEINQDVRLILLVLFTGALGACVTALQSLADYMGNERLKRSWVAFYFVRPAVGAGVAFVFYLVLRGGLGSGAGFDASTVNPFGLTAVAALVGMFSDKAMLKLQEVFTTLFKADDTRKDKLKVFDITTAAQLPDAKATQPYTHKLEAAGGAPPYIWTAETALPAWLSLDSAKGELTGTPPAAKQEGFTIRVKDASGASLTREFKLTVKP